ncbi:hypothetical protein PTE30175_02724 [Pandoraea terrae]|uniref:Uncharacterized protein n=1 Tax=Pandoraea terrae TaxID=1537710 RepID=A0A5E4VQD9_9BURK|nr:hypothetical protein [Pandoraea terrae]VVE14431.1 hypothetical protein PTE30175_02724 [Pandoraea terrae]
MRKLPTFPPRPASRTLARRAAPLGFASATAAIALLLASGCASVPPPGAPIARLPASQMTQLAPPLSDAERQRLTQLDARILAEQERAIANERAWAAYSDAARAYWNDGYPYGGYGWPRWYGGPYYGVGIGFGF